MGLATIFSSLFGGGSNVIVETAGAFIPNAEASAQRAHDADGAAMSQYSTEFNARNNRGWFEQLVDGLNRLPRPLMVFAIFGLLIYTPLNPLLMSEVFTAWALIPDGMWAITTVVVGFYFGGRMQLKGQNFRAQMNDVVARAPEVIANIAAIRALRHDSPNVAADDTELESGGGDNQALRDWRAGA